MIKILFLAANPKDTDSLRLGEETREIKERLRLAEFRDEFIFQEEHAVRVTDLQGHLLRHQPHIVHFSGHGSASGQIILEDHSGYSNSVSPEALKRLFATLRDNIRCVVLNACFSEAQAAGIVESIDCVVGMSRAIADKSAIGFAASFYQALAYGRSIQTAFESGCVEIALQPTNNPGGGIPRKDPPRELGASPEVLQDDDTPKLKVRAGIDPAAIYLAVSQTNERTNPSADTSKLTGRTATSPSAGQQNEYKPRHSCFISYCSEDEEFASKLHARLVKAGVKMWFAPEDLQAGKKLHEQIGEAIHERDKLLLVLSKQSMASEWVATEIRKARKIESKDGKRKLFPIRLVPFDVIRDWERFDADSGKDLGVEIREYFIPDFSKWKDQDAFETAFARLLRDLKAEEPPDPR
jgi:TIR domain/CHAT domain